MKTRYEFPPEHIEALLRLEPRFTEHVRRLAPPVLSLHPEPFAALMESIVSQQLSGRVATVIFDRVRASAREITPKRIADLGTEGLRGCGISQRKAACMLGAAEAALSGAVDFRALPKLCDEEANASLTRLKGVGVWTAEMLLIFSLGRPDVLSYLDLGIRRGHMLLYGRDTEPTRREFDAFRQKVSPYGTLASLYLWQLK